MSRGNEGTAADLREAVSLFSALGDPTRLGLLLRISREGPESISRLSSGSLVSRQAITRHLNVLAKAGMVRGSRQGREHIWELEPERLADARHYLQWISLQWEEALGRLKTFVEDEDRGDR